MTTTPSNTRWAGYGSAPCTADEDNPADTLEADLAASLTAHRLAEEIANRVAAGRPSLGTPSVYNITREVLLEHYADPERYTP